MFHAERDDGNGHFLIVQSRTINRHAQIDDVRRAMKAAGVKRGILHDVVSDLEPPDEALPKFNETVRQCFSHDAVLLIPTISPILEAQGFHNRFVYWLVASGVPFLAFDRPELTRTSLIAQIQRTGQPITQEFLDRAVAKAMRFAGSVYKDESIGAGFDYAPEKAARCIESRSTDDMRAVLSHAAEESGRSAKSEHIRQSLVAAKARGVKLGNPRIAEARAKARTAYEATMPSHETLALIAAWRQEGQSLREIAQALNDRGIKSPRGRKWYASSIANQLP